MCDKSTECVLSALQTSVNLHSVVYPYTSSSIFGAGSGPIFLSGLNCVGTEQTLLECSTSNHPYYYSHSRDAGVQCAHRQSTQYIGVDQLTRPVSKYMLHQCLLNCNFHC